MKIHPIIKRELEHRCLNCGKDLKEKIMSHEIHIHICYDCRQVIFLEYRKKAERDFKRLEKEAK